MLTGSARVTREAQEQLAAQLRQKDHDQRLRQLASRRKAIDAQIAALLAEADDRASEVELAIERERLESGVPVAAAKPQAGKRGARSEAKR